MTLNPAGSGTSVPLPRESSFSRLTAQIKETLTAETRDSRRGRKRKQASQPLPIWSSSKKRQVPPQKSAKEQSNMPLDSQDNLDTLLDEIKALGGDEQDLDLVQDVASGSDDEYGPTAAGDCMDDRFSSELTSFVKGLGFMHNYPPHDSSDDLDEAEPVAPAGDAATQSEHLPRQERRHGNLILETRPDWHAASLPPLPESVPDDVGAYLSVISSLQAHARGLLDADASRYNTSTAASSSQKFISSIMSSGTLSDKVSALTLAIQESPVHNIKAFESLMAHASKKGKGHRGQAISALSALVDLLGNGVVLPNDRRLRPFRSQPGLLGALCHNPPSSWSPGSTLPGGVRESHLVIWAYEDWLKDAYFKVIQLLEIWCADELEYSRSRSLDFVFGLLKDKPEQESNLLRLLVNKLGDRERKIASRASYLLLQLLTIHPGMKTIVVRMVEQEILLRSSQQLRAKYYAINTLNQTILSTKEPDVADMLLRVYFQMFVSLLRSGALGQSGVPTLQNAASPRNGSGNGRRKTARATGAEKHGIDQEVSDKLVSSILTGINRAVPFGATDESTLEAHLDTLFRITHSSNFNTSIQALMLIQQLSSSRSIAIDRYYRALYESLIDPRLITSSKQALYLNLLFRSLKGDVDSRRVKAFVKRMLQVLSLHQPSFICGILYLIYELHSTFPDLQALLRDPEDDPTDGISVSEGRGENDMLNSIGPIHREANSRCYDGRKRDPEYSNADQSCAWEILPTLAHFHPSVTVFAGNLMSRQKALPKPELTNHTLMQFLDKFVYRNPKSADGKRGGSIMQPGLPAPGGAHAVVLGKAGTRQLASVNSASFWKMKASDVQAEDVFFHEYFTRIGKLDRVDRVSRRKQAAVASSGVAGEDVESEEGEDEIWQALVASRPEMEIDADDLSDDEALDLSDLGSVDVGSDGSDMASDGASDEESGRLISDLMADEKSEDEPFADSDDAGLDNEADVGAQDRGRTCGGRMDRKKIRSLPMFASADDYAEMLADEDED